MILDYHEIDPSPMATQQEVLMAQRERRDRLYSDDP